MPKSDLVFGSFDTSTSGGKYYKTQPINFPTPEKDVEVYEVPGRSGDLVVDFGSYKNVEITAEIVIQATAPDTFLTAYDELRAAIMVQGGYQRLEDSLYSGEYRVARAVGVEMKQTDTMNGTANIVFDAKPQRYLTSGETVALTLYSSGSSDQTVGVGDTIFNADAIALLEGRNVDTSGLFTVVETGDYSSTTGHVLVRFYFPETYTGTVPIVEVWGTGSVLAGETLGSTYASALPIGNDHMLKIVISPYYYNKFNQVVVQGGVRWDIYDSDNDTILASGTPDTALLTPVANVMDYAPLITLGVSGAVSGLAALINDEAITLNTPATIGESAETITEVIIDCDTMNAYTVIDNTTYNLNSYVILSGSFSCPGNAQTVVHINDLIDSIEITPRWWTI